MEVLGLRYFKVFSYVFWRVESIEIGSDLQNTSEVTLFAKKGQNYPIFRIFLNLFYEIIILDDINNIFLHIPKNFDSKDRFSYR